jgi:hypothetical protein
MCREQPLIRIALVLGAVLVTAADRLPAQSGDLKVTAVHPPPVAGASVDAVITIDFDRPLAPSSITGDSFRAFGRAGGPVGGAFSFANGNRSVTLSPSRPFLAGDTVFVNLSRDIEGADGSSLRAGLRVVASAPEFEPNGVLSNRTRPDQTTQIYGALATDLNGDGFPDLTSVNEDTADLRVFLNRADGSGRYSPYLDPVPIGLEASPNESADFDNDGHGDVCVSAAISANVWITLGAGDGTFRSTQEVEIGGAPYGIAVLDADGDGDLDIANANRDNNNVALLFNNSNGVFSAPTFIEGGVNREYGLAAGDMDGDGITDLVVGGRDSRDVNTLLGRGNGTFAPAAASRDAGGLIWVVTLGDVNGDGKLDATTANSFSHNASVLLGNGDGTFGPADITVTGAHTVSTDLGDLDGDGDLDWVISSYGGGFWWVMMNDGTGSFEREQEFLATSNPSCAVLYDSDGDGDLDMALTDEIHDTITLMRHKGGSAERFRRGDGNGDGAVDLSDAVFGLLHLFAGGRAPACFKAADANDDGTIEVTDPIVILDYLFGEGALPGPLGCGSDPTPDALACPTTSCAG